jgi:hypothetical protein
MDDYIREYLKELPKAPNGRTRRRLQRDVGDLVLDHQERHDGSPKRFGTVNGSVMWLRLAADWRKHADWARFAIQSHRNERLGGHHPVIP